MYMQNTPYVDVYVQRQRLSTTAAAEARAFPRDKTLTKRTDTDVPIGGILAYLLGLAIVAVTTISGQFPWLLTVAAVMLIMALIFPRGARSASQSPARRRTTSSEQLTTLP